MNTGIQDAHNLAWKIASFVKGIASSSILYTYETERRPVLLLPLNLFKNMFTQNSGQSLTHHYISPLRLQSIIQNLASKTSKQPWKFLLHLVLIQLLQIQVTDAAVLSVLLELLTA